MITVCSDPSGICIKPTAHVPVEWHKAACLKVLQAVKMDFPEAAMVEKDSGTYIYIDSTRRDIEQRLGFWSVLEMDILIWHAKKAASELPLPV
jgi:hypothetical protein